MGRKPEAKANGKLLGPFDEDNAVIPLDTTFSQLSMYYCPLSTPKSPSSLYVSLLLVGFPPGGADTEVLLVNQPSSPGHGVSRERPNGVLDFRKSDLCWKSCQY